MEAKIVQSFLVLTLVLSLTVLACDGAPPEAIGALPPAEEGLVYIARDDDEMYAAEEEARLSISKFILALRNPKPNQTDFMIKSGFPGPNNDIEHLWISSLAYDGKQFDGYVASAPILVTNLRAGSHVTVVPEKVSDWIYVEDGKLVGGFSLRVLYSRMTDEERRQFDANSSFAIE